MMQCVNHTNYTPYFQKWDDWTCSIQVDNPTWTSLYVPMAEILPEHLYKYIVPDNITLAELGASSDGLHGLWPGQTVAPDGILPGAPFTYSQLTTDPTTTVVGTGPWKLRSYTGYNVFGGLPSSISVILDSNSGFLPDMKIIPGELSFKYTWIDASEEAQPSGGYYRIGLDDLSILALAYGSTGIPPSAVPITSILGGTRSWNPSADLQSPSGSIGLSDLVTLAEHYGWYWGNYSYDAPYPYSEMTNSS